MSTSCEGSAIGKPAQVAPRRYMVLRNVSLCRRSSRISPLSAKYTRLGPRYVLGFPGVVEDHLLIVLRSRADSEAGGQRDV